MAELERRLSELEGGGVHALLGSMSTPPSGSAAAPRVHRQSSSSTAEGDTTFGTTPSSSSSPPPPPPLPDYSSTTAAGDLFLGHLFPSAREVSSWPTKESVASSRLQRVWDSLWPLPGEAEVLLAMYREKVEHLFPFVVVPEMKAAEMKEQRPFLWKAVMMVGCFLDGARHSRLGEELLAEIGRAAMVDGDRSLDLLQGLQLLVAW